MNIVYEVDRENSISWAEGFSMRKSNVLNRDLNIVGTQPFKKLWEYDGPHKNLKVQDDGR